MNPALETGVGLHERSHGKRFQVLNLGGALKTTQQLAPAYHEQALHEAHGEGRAEPAVEDLVPGGLAVPHEHDALRLDAGLVLDRVRICAVRAVQVDINQLDPVLKALVFQLLESTSLSCRWFQIDSTCTAIQRVKRPKAKSGAVKEALGQRRFDRGVGVNEWK